MVMKQFSSDIMEPSHRGLYGSEINTWYVPHGLVVGVNVRPQFACKDSLDNYTV